MFIKNMGIFLDHRFEYRIYRLSGSFSKIAKRGESDPRVAAFLHRQARHDYGRLAKYERRATEIDWQLKPQEHDLLQKSLKVNPENIDHHGWYEVREYSTTYDI